MKRFNLLNNITGWLAFIIASTVYLMTAEPTASWWDCGEYIATACKLQVGHPPGAPTFQLFGRFFSLFAGDVSNIAFTINAMSAIASGFTVLFLFWSITLLARKLMIKDGEISPVNMFVTLAAGFVGSMAYTFSDSAWFSAVEGEVYATSSFFTAIVFWAILKWESKADEKHHMRWLILIAYLVGISIGVHLLNLLAIPAIVYVYYYKRYTPTRKGLIWSGIISIILLFFILYGVIPMIVNLAGKFELVFVNGFGMPFNSGTIVYFILLIGGIVWGIRYSVRKQKYALNTALLSLVFLLIGYSTFFILIIRANANTPINENAPKDAIGLLSYLNREQYGDRALVYGPYYNAKMIDQKEGSTKYAKGKEKYDVVGKEVKPVWDPAYCTAFPRMSSNDESRQHPKYYKFWAGINGDRKPTFVENMKFMFRYQIGHMYWRYFMWNFAGRQNDIQGLGYNEDGTKDIMHGNWISGIPFFDKMRLGPQDNLPKNLKENKARNRFFMLPLFLGLLGLFFHWTKNSKDAFVVMLLFAMTGLAIVLYLNQPPVEPRERDYAFAGSFYAFAIWIGLGVIGLYDFLSKKVPQYPSAVIAFGLTLVLVPGVMAKEGWDDHDRSQKYAARDIAVNHLMSCEPNSILITNGDNDTFPLWYAQEVEGVRTDVRVVNFTLSSGAWYVEQLFNKVYKSDKLPFTLAVEQYRQGTNDWVPVRELDGINGYVELRQLIQFVASSDPQTKATTQQGETISYVPARRVKITVNKEQLLKDKIVPQELANMIVPEIVWEIQKSGLYKNDLMLLDFIASNNFKRPLYFVSPYSVRDIADITNFCQMEGLVYKFSPVVSPTRSAGFGGINTAKTYDLLMNKMKWGNLEKPGVYVDPESYRSAQVIRNQYVRLANGLMIENKMDSAKMVLKRGIEIFPVEKVPFDIYTLSFAQMYYLMKDTVPANNLCSKIIDYYEDQMRYFDTMPSGFKSSVMQSSQETLSYLSGIRDVLMQFKQTALVNRINKIANGRLDVR